MNLIEDLLNGGGLESIFEDGSRFITINNHEIFGYCRYYDFYKQTVEAATNSAHIVEVGSFMGQSSAIMGYLMKKYNKKFKFDCVDLFENSEYSDDEHENYIKYFGGDLYKTFINNLEKSNTLDCVFTIYKGKSVDVANRYDDLSLDMVYLDASHKFQDVVDDIEAWWPKLKNGGILAGDDWDHVEVPKAVLHCVGEDNEDSTRYSGIYKYGTWFVEKQENEILQSQR